jgi:hypothetical protein
MIQKHCPVVMAIISQASPFGPKSHFVGISQTLTAVPVDMCRSALVARRLIPNRKKTAPPFQMTQREGLLSYFPRSF